MGTALTLEVPTRTLSDEEIVAKVLSGDVGMFRVLMRRHNQRLYRAVRAVLKDEQQTEDVMQEAYLRAFSHLIPVWTGILSGSWRLPTRPA